MSLQRVRFSPSGLRVGLILGRRPAAAPGRERAVTRKLNERLQTARADVRRFRGNASSKLLHVMRLRMTPNEPLADLEFSLVLSVLMSALGESRHWFWGRQNRLWVTSAYRSKADIAYIWAKLSAVEPVVDVSVRGHPPTSR